MASDHTPPSRDLEPGTVEAIRAVLARSLATGNHSDDLKEVLCAVAAEAREKGLLAERLLIILKEVWYSLPPLAGAKASPAETKLLQELISRCIHEYYAA